MGDRLNIGEHDATQLGFYNTYEIKTYGALISLEGILNAIHRLNIEHLRLSKMNVTADKPQVMI